MNEPTQTFFREVAHDADNEVRTKGWDNASEGTRMIAVVGWQTAAIEAGITRMGAVVGEAIKAGDEAVARAIQALADNLGQSDSQPMPVTKRMRHAAPYVGGGGILGALIYAVLELARAFRG